MYGLRFGDSRAQDLGLRVGFTGCGVRTARFY